VIVASNTTPIISLYKISRLHLLQDLFGQVIVPSAVYNEIAICGKPGYDAIDTVDFISVCPIKNMMAANLLQPQLDLGEAEAIVLAKEMNADLLLLDEAKARKIAHVGALKIIGTVGILQLAKEKGLIPAMKDCLDALITQNIWIDKKLYHAVLSHNNEQ